MATMAEGNDRSLLMSWRWAICRSDLPPHTRHILHVLGFVMELDGSGCQMSTRKMADLTGLSRSTVRTHLKPAEGVWVEVERDTTSVGDADANVYLPKIPGQGVGREAGHLGREPVHRGPPAGRGVGREPDTISTKTSTPTPLDRFEEIWTTHRRGAKKKAREEYRRAVPGRITHELMIAALRAYVRSFGPGFRGADLFRWIRDDRWEEQEGQTAPLDPAAHVRNPGLLSSLAAD